jgi:hypothetical protein
VTSAIGQVLSTRLATLHELDTVYGVEDVYDLLEVASVDAYNQRQLNKRAAKE